jgi:transposase
VPLVRQLVLVETVFDEAEPSDHGLGRSRGGFGSKLHVVCDGNGIPLAVTLTAGQVHESTQFETVVEAVDLPPRPGRRRLRPTRIAGDKGYHARRIRSWLRRRGIHPVIPPRKTRGKPRPGRPFSYNRAHYKLRNVMERCVGWLKECRSVATRYEKLALNYLTMVKLACIERYLRLLTAN